MALGTFDGVHLGHQQLLRRAVETRPEGGFCSVFTFDYPPEQVFSGDLRVLTDMKRRQQLIVDEGIDEIVWVDFDREFAAISPEQFVQDILVRALNASHVVCGFNFRFGSRAQGDADFLTAAGKQHGFSVEVIPPYTLEGLPVSSTRIRQALSEGRVDVARNLLGRYHSYQGIVTSGAGRGRKLGFPTANLSVPKHILLPREGVYFTWTMLDDGSSFPSVTAIGNNPTFSGEDQTFETYVLDFEGNLYDRSLTVVFLERLRDIFRYNDISQLKGQINRDVAEARILAGRFCLQDDQIVLK